MLLFVFDIHFAAADVVGVHVAVAITVSEHVAYNGECGFRLKGSSIDAGDIFVKTTTESII